MGILVKYRPRMKKILSMLKYYTMCLILALNTLFLPYTIAETTEINSAVRQKAVRHKEKKQMEDFSLQTKNTEAQSILSFWFGEIDDPEYGKPRALWFEKSVLMDQTIKARFSQLHEKASQGVLKDWEKHPTTLLALIILLDQFSRHIYRHEAAAFSTDRQARALAIQGLEEGFDQQVMPIGRVFYYLPLEHSENMIDQARSVALFTALYKEYPMYKEYLTYAQMHYDVIAQFGRFPHRNKILGRVSSSEEEKYLNESGVVF